MKKYILFLLICSFLYTINTSAQVGKQQTLFVKTNYTQDGTVTLSWPKDDSFEGVYYIFEKMELVQIQ